MDLIQLQALLLTLKEHGVKQYADKSCSIVFENGRPIHRNGEVAREQGSAGEKVRGITASAPADSVVPPELEKLNPLYFDPDLGLEITRRGI